MRARLLVAIFAIAVGGVVLNSCSDVTQPGAHLISGKHGPDREFVYIPEYSVVECWGYPRWDGAWVTECYQMDYPGHYIYMGSGGQPQINAYCKSDVYEPYCTWSGDAPSGGGGPGPSEFQNLTVERGALDDDELISPPLAPNCNPLPSDPKIKAWCQSSAPDTSTEAGRKADLRIRNALFDMRQISDSCARRADVIQAIYDRGELHIFPEKAIPAPGGGYVAGFSPRGFEEDGYLGLSEVWTKYAYDNSHKTKPKYGSSEPSLKLQNALAHEADHLLGWGHPNPDPNPWSSPNTLICGG